MICIVQENNSGNFTYTWSVSGNPDIPDECDKCDIDTSLNTATLTLRPFLRSYCAGAYTCTVSESGKPDTASSNNFTVTIAGKKMDVYNYSTPPSWHHVITTQVLE